MSANHKRMRLASPIEDELSALVKAVLTGPPNLVAKIVEHLVSPQVGITAIKELQWLKMEMLPSTVVPPIKAVQLLDHFKTLNSAVPGSSTSSDTEAASRETPRATPTQSANRASTTKGGFQFTVPWNTLPKKELEDIDLAELKKIPAKQRAISKMKLDIVKKLVSSYISYKETHPGQQKHPGALIYDSIRDQCFLKYEFALCDMVNGEKVGNGTAGFRRSILVCTENMMRDKDNEEPSSSTSKAVQRAGLVGVLEEEYLPQIDLNDRESLEDMRADLQSTYNEDSDNWDWDAIKRMQEDTYSLQREDIMSALDKILQQQKKNEEKENCPDEEPDEPEEKAVSELQQQWPFLFTVGGLKWHHDRLTGRPQLLDRLNEFLDKNLDKLCLYLVSCSKTNKANIAINARLEKIVKWTPGKTLLKALYMLANHFSEKIDILVHKVEKTASSAEILTEGLRDLCIIAHDQRPFDAETFYLVTDEVIISEAFSFQEALTSLVYISFILDLHYPKMPQSFEFIERYIYGLGISDSKVKCKNGKRIQVLTPAVRNLVNGLEEFGQEMDQDDGFF